MIFFRFNIKACVVLADIFIGTTPHHVVKYGASVVQIGAYSFSCASQRGASVPGPGEITRLAVQAQMGT